MYTDMMHQSNMINCFNIRFEFVRYCIQISPPQQHKTDPWGIVIGEDATLSCLATASLLQKMAHNSQRRLYCKAKMFNPDCNSFVADLTYRILPSFVLVFGYHFFLHGWERMYPAYHVTMLELATIGNKLAGATTTHAWQIEIRHSRICPKHPSSIDLFRTWIPNMPVALHFFNVWPRTFHSCLLAGRRSPTMPQSQRRRTRQKYLRMDWHI